MSATLKIGHHCTSMKSMTPPLQHTVTAEHPVGEVAERAADQHAGGDAGERGSRLERCDTTSDDDHEQREQPMTGPRPRPREKAMPLL